ncbi:MAG: hypothetical protein A2882_08995 [Phenylobacterium sp. RIFCSPHIGHO2_01_FULL_70_10]|nr:MAG: hypothetical protein A2882_08995 [Phenylobacterium sp. RIFCSPHIGHO2_01_FULL_70_10]
MLLDGVPNKIADVLTDLTARASTFGAALHPRTAQQLASLAQEAAAADDMERGRVSLGRRPELSLAHECTQGPSGL